MIDYHLHSDNSGDAVDTVMAMCRAAVDRGLTDICFTEHIDFEPTDSCYGAFDHARYTSEVEFAREACRGKLTIALGIEVDYQEQYHSRIRDFLDGKTFDYVLGASHYVDGVILEDHERYFPGRTAEQAYAPYFDNTLAAVETGWFDALAHLDLCKRYGVRYLGPFDETPYRERLDEILRAVVRRNMSLEVNTSGLRQSPNDTYPGVRILARHYELGGRNIIVGSDAHKTGDVGAGLAEALQMVGEAGFESIDTFRRRRRCKRNIADLIEPQGGLGWLISQSRRGELA